MSGPYSNALVASSGWIDDQPGLREAMTQWAARPRSGHALVGHLHRPSLGSARGLFRRTTAMPSVTARWLRSPDRGMGAATFALMVAATGSPGGRDIIQMLRGVRPDLLDGLPHDIVTTPPAMSRAAVERRVGAAAWNRLTEFDDDPVSISEFDQVHRGRLDDGTSVAVAVSRPGVAGRLRDDARTLAPWLVAAEVLDPSPWRDGLVEILRDLVAAGIRRCDQRAVALDAAVLHTALEASGIDDVRVARPMPELVDGDSAVFALPTGEHLRQRAPRSAALATGISTIAETGLVHGVYATHLDRDYLWGDRHGVTTLVGGASIAEVRESTRRALAEMLLGLGRGSDPVDALVAVGVVPPFADASAVRQAVDDGGLANPLALVGPGGAGRVLEAGRRLVLDHGARATPELVGLSVAVVRLVSVLRDGERATEPSDLLQALPRLAGIGSRISAAA